MREYLSAAGERAQAAITGRSRQMVVVCIILLVLAGGVAAQTISGTQQDTFEDQSTEGWNTYGTYPDVVQSPNQTSGIGSYSLYAKSLEEGKYENAGNIIWEEGPVLDTNEAFDVHAKFRPAWVDPTQLKVRIGLLSQDEFASGQNALVLFNKSAGITYLATNTTADPPSNQSNIINRSFARTWVNVRIQSNGEGTVRAKVWEVGTSEPVEWQLTQDFEGATGQFGYNIGDGLNGQEREAWLDSVTIEGTVATDPSLNIHTRQLYLHNATHEYKVVELRNESGNNVSYRVTENATVESLDTNLLTVDQVNETMTATSNESLSGVAVVRATYNNSTAYAEVTVAKPTVENLEIVPGIWRINAVVGDSTLFALLIATLLAVPAARYTSAFGGLAMGQMVLVVGWLGGYVGFGIAAVSVFVSLFIGLNLAANINYMGGRLGGQ